MARALFFTQQTVGLGARKTSMLFLAEAFAEAGWDVGVVTVQLSHASRLRRDSRLAHIAPDRRNRWYDAGALQGYVWVAPVHPMRLPGEAINRATAPLLPLYGAMLPTSVRRRAALADLIVIESCSAVAPGCRATMATSLPAVANDARSASSRSRDAIDASR